MSSSRPKKIHPLWLRCCHWVNAITIAEMMFSGCRIYNASPLFDFSFPAAITLGGWLGSALQWHFAMMWVLVINGAVYLTLGIVSGRFRRKFFPLSPHELRADLLQVLRGKLKHADLSHYKYASQPSLATKTRNTFYPLK
ncbi:TPA: cytochrome b/b6 domain-containing protein [Klebsiella pneumoniae]|nr:cytochrome b/b6 domain-containing protein [Klebsiella pneumoniae]HDY9362097.1 cytochrome b/b6 domain-containing protein [Klebsiella pneumoniae]